MSKEPEQNYSPEDSELTLEDIFVNLRLISRIEVGDKLIQNNKHVNIDNSYLQFITRKLNGSNRNDNLSFINHVLIKAYQYNDNLIGLRDDNSAQLLFRLTTDLKNAINGLINLKLTYCADKLVQSEIDVMIENIRAKIESNSKQLNFGY
jgi:hypothetical protein